MKPLVILLVTTAVGLLGFSLFSADDETDPSSTSTVSPPIRKPPPPTSTLHDSLKIFRSAFWRSPVAGDVILNAERREWSDADGLNKWQWFIALHPSPELLNYVREANSFGLRKSVSLAPVLNAPGWFATDRADVEVLRSSGANLQFIFNRADNTLYATNSGKGFTRGAPPRARAVSPPMPRVGRLPPTPPPNRTKVSSRTGDDHR